MAIKISNGYSKKLQIVDDGLSTIFKSFEGTGEISIASIFNEFLLGETGNYLFQENGDKIIL